MKFSAPIAAAVGITRGTRTRRNVVSAEAPRFAAASSKEELMPVNAALSRRRVNGILTRT